MNKIEKKLKIRFLILINIFFLVFYLLDSSVIKIIMMAGPKSKMRIKTPIQWGVFFFIMSQVPFSHNVGTIAKLFQILW